ncbi:GNAT family N-acetyltransferase [Streptosporangiaceae bacterium NEAU-GS5]|nr:GNAT family N-acetyltransferase [Streptosporangiaceae bacterium NEAU-GS5]
MLDAYDSQMRHQTSVPGVECQVDGPIVRHVGMSRGFVDAPRDTGLRGAALDELIARQRDFFAARGEGVEWKTFAHDEPADLTERLTAAGFVPEEPETVLIGLAEQMAADPVLPDGLTLREIASLDDLGRMADMLATVWDEERGDLADDLAQRIAADPLNTVILVVESGNAVVCSARIEFNPGTDFAGLWGGATLAEWRGKGIYRALVARRAQIAVDRGVRYLQVDASEDSRPILQRLGFHAVTTTTPYVWTPEVTGA